MIVALLTAAACVLLPILYMGNMRAERRRRGELFADSLALFDKCRVTQEGMRFPVLEGRYRGLPVRLEPVLDDIGLRKLPSLWLKTTLLVANPRRGVLDFIVRPQGIEVYSPSHDLHTRLEIPAGWPQHAILCTDDAGKTPPLAVLMPHMRAFEDKRMKELLITPLGVRLVYQAAQAQRGEYLVLRQARFTNARIDRALIKALLNRVQAIAVELDAVLADPEAKPA